MKDITKIFEDLNKEYNFWILGPKYLQDKKDYSESIDEEVRKLALIVCKNEDYFIWWYMNTKHRELSNKTPYEYVKINGATEVKRLINGLISPPGV